MREMKELQNICLIFEGVNLRLGGERVFGINKIEQKLEIMKVDCKLDERGKVNRLRRGLKISLEFYL